MKKNRVLGIVLGCLGIVIVGLVVAILVVNLNRNTTENGTSSSEETVEESQEETLEEQVAEAGNDVEKIIEIYQGYIDAASGEEKADLLTQRIFAIQAVTLTEYGDQVVADSRAVDDILQTESSAIQVANNASVYGMDDVMREYAQIAEERAGDVPEDIEGRG